MKRIISAILTAAITLTAYLPAMESKAAEISTVQESKISGCCGTGTELMSEIHSTLLKKQE